MNRLTCVDLFSGAGGLSRGFMDAGYDVVLGVDFDDAALKTFKANLKEFSTLAQLMNFLIINLEFCHIGV